MKKGLIIISLIFCCSILFTPRLQLKKEQIEITSKTIEFDPICLYINSINNTANYSDIIKYTKQYTISEDQFIIMIGLFSVESKFNKNANSYLGPRFGRGIGQVSEIGLTQYNWSTNSNIKSYELYNLEINIKVACWLYNYYQNHYNLNELETCMSYNKGVNGYRKNTADTRYYNKIISEVTKISTINNYF